MSYQPRYDPHSSAGPVAGPWAAQPGSCGAPAEGADDGWVRLAGWIFFVLAALFAATVAVRLSA